MNELEQLIKAGSVTDPQSAKGRLLTVATELFQYRGFERTTVRELARAVGIQSGSIFHHFRSKEEILLTVMREAIIYVTALMRTALKQADNNRGRLLALIRCELEAINGITAGAMCVLVYEWRSLSDEGQAEILALRDTYESLWLTELNEAAANGRIQAESGLVRRLLTGAISWTATWYKSDGPLSIDELAEQTIAVIWHP